MTADNFRKMALENPHAVESAHVNLPDFRINGKLFATRCSLDDEWGMVKQTPERQHVFIEASPRVFDPCNGAWGRGGATSVHLA